MTLSKSQYTRALQCHKSLWMHKNSPSTRDTPDTKTQSNYDTGYVVGELARVLYQDFISFLYLDSFDTISKLNTRSIKCSQKQ